MLHGRLLRVSELVVVSRAVVGQQRIAHLKQTLHHADSAAFTAETLDALLDARQNEARAIDLPEDLGLERIQFRESSTGTRKKSETSSKKSTFHKSYKPHRLTDS